MGGGGRPSSKEERSQAWLGPDIEGYSVLVNLVAGSHPSSPKSLIAL